LRENGFGGELDVVADRGGPAAVPVGGPRLGQIQLPVDQGAALAGGVGEEHTELAVLDPPRGTGVLALHAGGFEALLQEPGLVDDQHAGGVAEVLHDVAAHVITHSVGVPVRRVQQPLHPVRGRVPRDLGQRPAVLARQRSQQPAHIRPRPPPRLRPQEPAGDLREQPIQPDSPRCKIRITVHKIESLDHQHHEVRLEY
jgi:hypothetical protein